ncbi:SHOCT domain-containing protein [Pseudonocardia xinjiangensis]|uniref:SHOCT domain-containing protein n=1 Tax=Pseudonocardia xinjiangensis TaxID=75289 RepID=UPI003D8FAD70
MTGVGAAAAAAPPAAPGPRPIPPSALDELRKLAELRDAGTVTQQEFEAAKARLLGGLTSPQT